MTLCNAPVFPGPAQGVGHLRQLTRGASPPVGPCLAIILSYPVRLSHENFVRLLPFLSSAPFAAPAADAGGRRQPAPSPVLVQPPPRPGPRHRHGHQSQRRHAEPDHPQRPERQPHYPRPHEPARHRQPGRRGDGHRLARRRAQRNRAQPGGYLLWHQPEPDRQPEPGRRRALRPDAAARARLRAGLLRPAPRPRRARQPPVPHQRRDPARRHRRLRPGTRHPHRGQPPGRHGLAARAVRHQHGGHHRCPHQEQRVQQR